MLKSVASDYVESKEERGKGERGGGPHSLEIPSQMESVLEGVQKSLNLGSIPKSPASHRRTNSILITHFSTNIKASNITRSTKEIRSTSNRRMGENPILEGRLLKELLEMKPELAEYLFMEIENLKLVSEGFVIGNPQK